MIACLGETTGYETLQNILKVMKSSPEGTHILMDKPRINSKAIDLDALGKLPVDTFGYAYKKFLDDNVSILAAQIPFKIYCLFAGALFISKHLQTFHLILSFK